MALTVAKTLRTVIGNKKLHAGTITFDATYPAGGEAVTAADLGLRHLDLLTVTARNTELTPLYLKTTGKIKLTVGSTGVENATADQSACIVDFQAIGY
jgi:hypothetical protein